MERWNTLSEALVSTERLDSTSTDATPPLDPAEASTTRPSVSRAGTWISDRVETSGQTTMSIPQTTPLLMSRTATEPSASVSSTDPVSPPALRLPLKAPERISVSGSHRQPIEGSAPARGSIFASIRERPALGGTGGFQTLDEAKDPVQGRL